LLVAGGAKYHFQRGTEIWYRTKIQTLGRNRRMLRINLVSITGPVILLELATFLYF
jgi:hypothetical protein